MLQSLKKGDSIALVLPASKLEVSKIETSKKHFRSLGYFVADYPDSFKKDTFFASSDEKRAKQLDWAFSEPGIKAVFCCRGGYGSMRLLPHLEKMNLKRWRQKAFVGFSDITFLHQWIQNRFGWKTFHGPLVGELAKKDIKKLCTQVEDLKELPKTQVWKEAKPVRSGKAKGVLVGGNLSLLQTSGPAALPKKDMVLCIEEINESYYKMDRMIWQLIHAGYKEHIKAIILGTMKGCGKADAKTFKLSRFMKSVEQLTDGPIWRSAKFGHGLKQQRLLVLGSLVQLQSNKLKYLESVVEP